MSEPVEGRCPECDAVIVEATAKTRATPVAGDCAICLYCRTIAVFTGNGFELRRPTLTELDRFLSDPEVRRAISIATVVDELRR